MGLFWYKRRWHITDTYKIAGRQIEICSLYDEVHTLCREHRAEGSPDFTVAITQADLDCPWKWQEAWFDLIILCYADAEAQNDKVYSGEKLIDSKVHKINKIAAIEMIFESMYQR